MVRGRFASASRGPSSSPRRRRPSCRAGRPRATATPRTRAPPPTAATPATSPTPGPSSVSSTARPATALPPLPALTNVVATEREDSVGIDFDPVDDAVDYRVYPLPADGDIAVGRGRAGHGQERHLPLRRASPDLRRGEQPEQRRRAHAAELRRDGPLHVRRQRLRVEDAAPGDAHPGLRLRHAGSRSHAGVRARPATPWSASSGGARAGSRSTRPTPRSGRRSSPAGGGTTASPSTCPRRRAPRRRRSTARRPPSRRRARATRSTCSTTFSRPTWPPTRRTRRRRRLPSRC